METVEEFIEQQRAYGSYSFSWEMIQNVFSISEKALRQALYRQKTKGKIANIRRDFYIIIPPEFAKMGIIPTSLFIDDLMKSLDREYYVGLFSAAAIHGASHQAVMEYYVISSYPPLRNIVNRNLKINFFSKKTWRSDFIVKRKTDAGYINVSCPELTAIDLLNYGGFSMNRVATVLEELIESFNKVRLRKVIKQASNTSIQRLGYLLETVIIDNSYLDILQQELSIRKVFPTPLSSNGPQKGEISKKWKVVANIKVESDL